MKKEPILAIIIGSLVGVFVAFFVWQVSKYSADKTSSKPETKQEEIEKTEKKQVENNNRNSGLSIVSPASKTVTNKDSVTISGFSTKNSILAIENNGRVTFETASLKGEFEVEVNLEAGLNSINITSFSEENMSSEMLLIVYSTQVEDSKATILMGTVTDISEKTLQLKTEDDVITQASVDDETTYSKIIKKQEDLEFSEIALGDFIIIIGKENGNGVFASARILVTNDPGETAITAVYGEIQTLSSSDFIVVDFSEEEFSIDATGKVSITKLTQENEIVRARLKEASEGEMIIIVGELEEELTASKIHIFPEVEEE